MLSIRIVASIALGGACISPLALAQNLTQTVINVNGAPTSWYRAAVDASNNVYYTEGQDGGVEEAVYSDTTGTYTISASLNGIEWGKPSQPPEYSWGIAANNSGDWYSCLFTDDPSTPGNILVGSEQMPYPFNSRQLSSDFAMYAVGISDNGNYVFASNGEEIAEFTWTNPGSGYVWSTPDNPVTDIDFYGTQTQVAAIAVDNTGNAYVTTTSTSEEDQVLLETAGPDGFSQTTIATASGAATFGAIAVDVQGNVYVADVGDAEVLKFSPNGTGGYNETILATGIDAVAIGANWQGRTAWTVNCLYTNADGTSSILSIVESGPRPR